MAEIKRDALTGAPYVDMADAVRDEFPQTISVKANGIEHLYELEARLYLPVIEIDGQEQLRLDTMAVVRYVTPRFMVDHMEELFDGS